MRAGVAASAPMALTPSLMPGPTEGCAKNRRREADCIIMFAPGIGAVNRNECDNRRFLGEFNRILRCVLPHKRYSRPCDHFRRLPCGSTRGNAGALGPKRKRQDYAAALDQCPVPPIARRG